MRTGSLFCLIVLSVIAWGTPCVSSEQAVFEFVRKYCIRCHNGKKTSGDLNLRALQQAGRPSFDESREAWERVVSKLKTGEMPPEDARSPEVEDVNWVTEWIGAEFARQDRAIEPQAGRVTARRLNRAEYRNTVRDLLGVDIRGLADFPADQAAFGFDNISDALRLSPVLMEKYLNAAERAVRTAIFGPAKLDPAITHYPLPVRINLSRDQQTLPEDLFRYDYSGLSLVYSAHVAHYFPVDGEYSFRVVLNGHRPNQSDPARPALFIDGVLAKAFEVDATDLEGQFVETRLNVDAGERLLSVAYLKVYHGLPPQYNGPEPSERDPRGLLSKNGEGELTKEDIELLRKLGTKIKTDRIETRVDNRFESIDVGGPFTQRTEATPESLKKVFVCEEPRLQGHTQDCTRTILTNFASRAYRRPAKEQEVEGLLRLVALVQEQGSSWEEGIATALQAILVSPHFLFRLERDPDAEGEQKSAPVTDYEFASRLSYFLWSSTPDAELLSFAREQRLRQPGVLAHQVRRMLADARSRALVENFAGQWLLFQNMDVVRPDVRKFPEFEVSLRRSMRRETERFIEEIVREDRSVLEVLDADYTFVDERLARFYGIDGVEGPEFRRVNVRGGRRRGGVLSHASFLTISSYSTRTSPVLRGKWILENLLNTPPPPPPPSVPPLDEAKAEQAGSLREQLEEHRKSSACAGCHARLDPLGFGLEYFDAIGAWRDQDGQPVDASGTLPSGRSFRGHHELKQILLEDRETFVRCLVEKLLIYALGRGLERYDRPTLAKIETRLREREHRFSELVLGIVESMPFQMRSVAETEESP